MTDHEGAPVGVVGELEREPSRIGSLSERRSLIVFGGASPGAHKRLKPIAVNEIETGQIDDHMRRLARLRIELPVKQGRGSHIERAAQPEDQYVGVALHRALGADHERPDRGRLRPFDGPERPAIRRDSAMRLVHNAPIVGLSRETVTGG
jgi:hypothetical protein